MFKKKLVEYFKKAQAERERSESDMVITYSKLAARWNKRVDRVENSRKRKEREAKIKVLKQRSGFNCGSEGERGCTCEYG